MPGGAGGGIHAWHRRHACADQRDRLRQRARPTAAGFAPTIGATITLINVTLSGNTASGGGGGMYADNDSVATLINSTVSGNRDTGQDGGGLYSDTGGTLTLINSTVWGNSTIGDGGGIYGFTNNVITLINSTVTGNSAGAGESGGGIYNDGANARHHAHQFHRGRQ